MGIEHESARLLQAILEEIRSVREIVRDMCVSVEHIEAKDVFDKIGDNKSKQQQWLGKKK